MEKGDTLAVGPSPDLRFDDLDAVRFRATQRGVQIGGGEADMVNAGSVAREESGDGRVVACGLEQFEPAGGTVEEHEPDGLGGNILGSGRVLSQQRSENGDGLSQGIDRDSDVVDTVHEISPVRS